MGAAEGWCISESLSVVVDGWVLPSEGTHHLAAAAARAECQLCGT